MNFKPFLIVALILTFALSCGEKNSPVQPSRAILTSFEARFGTKTKAKWKLSGQDHYQASFKKDRHPVKAYFDGNGNWQKTETELSSSEIPGVVIRTIVSAFHGSSINETIQVEKPGEGTTYLLTLKSGNKISTVELSREGVIVGGAMFK